MVHVPYQGSAPAGMALIGGHIELMFGSVPSTLPHVRSGKLRAIAVSSARRWPAVPQIPTVAESGLPGFEGSVWYGLLAPAGTPAAIISRIQADVATAINTADAKKYLEGTGFAGIANKPDEFAEVIRNDMARWQGVLRKINEKKR